MEEHKNAQLSDAELIALDREGFIPGPAETETAFKERVQLCLHFQAELKKELELATSPLPFSQDNAIPEENLKKALDKLETIYGTRPYWVPAFYNSQGLVFWQGGGTWIIELENASHPVTLFQLHEAFKKKATYLGLYSRDELLAHEYCHAARMAFEEPAFEEIFSYTLSESVFRQYLGPLVSNSRDVWIFLGTLLASVFTPLLYPALGSYTLLAPLTLIFLGLSRRYRRQKQLSRCLAKLAKVLPRKQEALAAAFRLTDKEIMSFSRWSEKQIRTYAETERLNSPRWRALYLRFYL